LWRVFHGIKLLDASAASTLSDQDFFSLLGLPRSFDVEPQVLESAWKKVALAVHPDRFATRSAAEKRVAMQWSSQANEAYRILKDPMSRARYLCELSGIDLQTETNTAMSSDFLLRQMSWHEQLDQILEQSIDLHVSASMRNMLQKELTAAELEITTSVSEYFDQERYDLAAARVREWMFLNKLIAQCRAID
jgi:molecular chaperone HscB